MKIKLASTGITVIASVCLGLMTCVASVEVKPLRGADVIVKNKTGGMTLQTMTSREGKFTFDKLEPGKYQLSIGVTDVEPPVSTTTASTKHLTKTKDGVQVDDVTIVFGPGKEAKPLAPVDIEITAKQGKITGVVTQDQGAAGTK